MHDIRGDARQVTAQARDRSCFEHAPDGNELGLDPLSSKALCRRAAVDVAEIRNRQLDRGRLGARGEVGEQHLGATPCQRVNQNVDAQWRGLHGHGA
jgi:hypothetical protein